MKKVPRVAFFPDSYEEVDGVAMTSKRLVGYAKKNGNPLLVIHAGKKTALTKLGSIRHLSLKRSPLALPMDETLKYDPFFQRHTNKVVKALLHNHWLGISDISNSSYKMISE